MKIACDFFIFSMIFTKTTNDFQKIYEKNVKSVKFVILTIAFFYDMTIISIGSWHSKFLSANDSGKMLLILAGSIVKLFGDVQDCFKYTNQIVGTDHCLS